MRLWLTLLALFLHVFEVAWADSVLLKDGKTYNDVRVEGFEPGDATSAVFRIAIASGEGSYSEAWPTTAGRIAEIHFHQGRIAPGLRLGRTGNITVSGGTEFNNAKLFRFINNASGAMLEALPDYAPAGEPPYSIPIESVASLTFASNVVPQEFAPPGVGGAGGPGALPPAMPEDLGQDSFNAMSNEEWSEADFGDDAEIRALEWRARLVMVLLIVMSVVVIGCQIWMTLLVFQEAGCLGVILCGIPYIGLVFSIYYLMQYWEQMKWPFLIGLSTGVACVGLMMVIVLV